MENLKINKKAKIGKYVLRGKALTLAVATALMVMGCSASEAEIEITPTATIAATATPKPTPKITPTPSPTPYTKMGAIKDIAKKKYREYLNAISPLGYRENMQYVYTLEDFENATCYMRRHYLTYGDESKVIVTDPNRYMIFCQAMGFWVTEDNYKKDGRIVFLNFSDYFVGEEFTYERETLLRLEKLYEENPEEGIREGFRYIGINHIKGDEDTITKENAAFTIALGFFLDSRLHIWNETTNNRLLTIPYNEVFPWNTSKDNPPVILNNQGYHGENSNSIISIIIDNGRETLEGTEKVGEVQR